MMIPNNIPVDLAETVETFWKRRLEAHTHDWYKDRGLAKMPEDLRTYQHIIEDCQPEVIVELGSYDGGSAIWFADQLSVLVYRDWRQHEASVISVDINSIRDGIADPRIQFVKGDVKSERVWQTVADLVGKRRVMVSEDTQHSHASTLAALEGFSHLVSPGCWFVVEDGIVDHPVKLPRYRGGVSPAIEEFLATEKGERFSRHYLQPYGLTTDIGGWLKAER